MDESGWPIGYMNSPTLFRMVPFLTPIDIRPPFLRFEVRNSHPKLQSLLSQERVKLQGKLRERGRIRGLSNFFE